MKTFDEYLDEVAPDNPEAEKFIKDNKAKFKEKYGDRWEEVLYATAWKQFGEANVDEISSLEVGDFVAQRVTQRQINGALERKRMRAEAAAKQRAWTLGRGFTNSPEPADSYWNRHDGNPSAKPGGVADFGGAPGSDLGGHNDYPSSEYSDGDQ